MDDVNILKNNQIDLDKGLELLGDIEMYNSILKEFYNGYYERMKKIESYKLSSDMPNYAIEVHALKSDSKYLGITKLADYAYMHEMASKANDTISVNKHYNELVIEGNRVITVIKKYFESTTSSDDLASNIPIVEEVSMITDKDIRNLQQTILVADDSSIIRDFIKEIFNDKYDVLMASNGQEVINIVKANSDITALLLDLNMPNIDGFGVLEYFKNNDLFNKIGVSVISGASDKDSINRAFSYDIVDMLNKPFNINNVKNVLEKTISLRK